METHRVRGPGAGALPPLEAAIRSTMDDVVAHLNGLDKDGDKALSLGELSAAITRATAEGNLYDAAVEQHLTQQMNAAAGGGQVPGRVESRMAAIRAARALISADSRKVLVAIAGIDLLDDPGGNAAALISIPKLAVAAEKVLRKAIDGTARTPTGAFVDGDKAIDTFGTIPDAIFALIDFRRAGA